VNVYDDVDVDDDDDATLTTSSSGSTPSRLIMEAVSVVPSMAACKRLQAPGERLQHGG
jgi:hypothetical protein